MKLCHFNTNINKNIELTLNKNIKHKKQMKIKWKISPEMRKP